MMDFHHPYSRGLPPRSEEPALFIRPPPRATPHPPHLPYSLPPSSTPYAPMAYGPAAYNHHQAHSQSQPQQQGQQQQQQPHYQPPTAASFPPTSTAPLSVPPSISQPSAPLESNSYRFPPVNHGSGMTQNQNQHQNRGRGRSYSRSHNRSNSYSYSQNHSPRVAAWVNKTNAMFGEGTAEQSSAPPTMSHPHRQMPPPPSPPQHYPARAQSTNAPPLSTPFFARDQQQQQTGNPAHRPGSSMSISSMLGSDADRPPREVGASHLFSRPPVSSSPSPFGSAPPASATPGAVMSPPTGPGRHSSLDYPLFRRSQTPEKSLAKNQHPPPRPYRSSSGGVSLASLPEQAKFGLSSRGPPSSSSQFPAEKPSPPISSAETAYNEPRRLSLNGPISRPNSQPQQVEPSASARSSGYSPLSRPAPPLGERAAPFSAQQQQQQQQQRPPPPPSYLEHGRYGGAYADQQSSDDLAHRERERTMGPEPPHRYSVYEERQQSSSAWDLNRSQPPSPESKRFPAPDPGSSGFGLGAIQSYTKSLGSQIGGSRPPSLPTTQPPRHEQQSTATLSGSEHGPYLPKLQTDPPRLLSSGLSTTGTASTQQSVDDKRKGSDELMHHRNLLGVGAEKRGRASPLPQAVQGALGPGGESTIKNDLGRVFSGIGSGVGGVTAPTAAGSGHTTPLAVSPFKRDSGTARSANGDTTDETRITRPGSTMGKRSRKAREEDSQMMDSEGVDQRTGVSGRGRRARHLHHHHHQYVPYSVVIQSETDLQLTVGSHHHHRSKAEEEAAAVLGSQRQPFFQRASTISAEGAGNVAPHHHHHHHPHHHPHHHHHHHHHPSRTSGSGLSVPSPVREPRTVVNIEPVRSSVSHLPRHHLGSTLYAPRIGAPTTHASMEGAKFGYTSTPQPLPRFEGKENCTFTVRVPRHRIDAARREEVCARRALWGTGIYTDDSDPVAAAIHSGYIRGSWGDDVDESILDLEIKDTYQHAPPASEEERESDQPRIPPVPPADKDLHITLLVLPRLDQYDASVLFGIKSRPWDGSHDGMSFQILRVDWVEEGAGRGEERGGEARRKRLRNLMQTGRICTGPASIKLENLRSGVFRAPKNNNKTNHDPSHGHGPEQQKSPVSGSVTLTSASAQPVS